MKVLYFDCFSGASGDMVVGALIDAGVSIDDIRRALGSLALDRDTVWTERVSRAGLRATKFCVRGEDLPAEPAPVPVHAHAHAHEQSNPASARDVHHAQSHDSHHASPHRTLAEVYERIDGSSLNSGAKDRSKSLFARLAYAEASIHGTTIDQVHLHEVGSLDSIVDVVSAVVALEAIGADRIVSSPLNVGSGIVRTAHGEYPVPAPATLRLLDNAPMYSGPQRSEMVTPTGALLVTAYATEYGVIPPMRLKAVGYGAGSRDFADTPNVLRVLIGEADASAAAQTVVVIEAEIDDMNPQIFGVVMDHLLAEGAVDVYYTPIQMKKNRPATLLSVVAPPKIRERLTAIIFRHTTTIGVRYREMTRECLDRESTVVGTPYGNVRIKVARRDGEILNAAPEFDDCLRLAEAAGISLKEVQAAATKAWLDSGLR